METLIPKESSREERPGGNASKQILWTFNGRLRGSPSFSGLFPKAFILLFICRVRGPIHDIITMEVSNATNEIGQHCLGEF
jgi:hypothetical protein